MANMKEQLDQYYDRVGIAPVDKMSTYDEMFSAFQCQKKDDCREACRRAWNEEEKFLFAPPLTIEGVNVSQCYYQDRNYYGDRIPRIVVLSLSRPQPVPDQDLSPPKRGNKSQVKPKPFLNPHWRETLAMVRSLLHPFIAPKKFPDPVRYWKDESRKEIEKLFVHVRTAKCCSNADGESEEPPEVYANCGGYLGEELSILEPDVIITQGNNAHEMAQKYAFNVVKKIKGLGLKYPIAHIVNLKEDNQSVYWLRSYFPRGRYYWHAGPKIDSESNVVGAKRKHLVRYGKKIKKFMENP